MKNIRYGLIVMWLLSCSVLSAEAQVSIGIGLPNLSIGINLPLFPELVPVPGYPVYYAPRLDANYFFYDGMYWVFENDTWYASSWYNGPWAIVQPEAVPLFILRVPVRYYRQPPMYFRGWRSNAPPRWGQHWGREWEQHRRGWDRWNRRAAPARAPLPAYQRQYSGDRYPRAEHQHSLRNEQYRYQPRDRAVRRHFQQQVEQRSPVPAHREMREQPAMRSPRHQDAPHPGPDSRSQPPRQPVLEQHGPAPREHQPPRMRDQEQRPHDRERQEPPGRGHGQGQDRGQGRDDERERGRGR